MIKTKIISVGILICIIAGCGIFNSEKFHPHHLDGLYKYTYEVHDPHQSFYTNFMFVDYPEMHVCVTSGEGFPPFVAYGKEEVKVARTKDHFYKVKEINGHAATSSNVIYKITANSSSHKNGMSYYLHVYKIKEGNEYYEPNYVNYSGDSYNKEYQQCISEASDTTGIFPATAPLKIKPD